jgi:hypothetical protein
MRQRKWHKALLYLGPSKIHGIGCFSDTGIKKGEFVRVWSPEDSRWVPLKKAHASPHKKLFQRFGIRTTGGYWAPIDFLRDNVLPGRQRQQSAKLALKRRPSGPPASDRPQARQPSRAAPPGHD